MIYNFDVWKSVHDVGLGKYTIAVFSISILLVLVHFLFTKFWAKDSVKRMMIVNLVWFTIIYNNYNSFIYADTFTGIY